VPTQKNVARAASLVFDITYVRLLVRTLGSSRKLDKILRAHGISAGDLTRGGGHIPYLTAAHLLRAIRHDLDVPHLGALIGSNLHLSMLGPLGIASLTNATVGEAQDEFMRFYRPMFPFCRWRVFVDGGKVRVEVRVVPTNVDADQVLTEALMLASHNSIELVSNQPMVLSVARFRSSPPTYAARFQQLFSGEVRFDAAVDHLIFPAAIRSLPVAFHAPALHSFAVEQLRMLRTDGGVERNAVCHVIRRVTESALAPPSLAELAGELGLSARTLIRHLRKQDTTYQELKDQMKSQYAASMLRLGDTTIEGLAADLGYHDASSFRRSFHRWLRCAPSEYRRAARRARE
jgi:AraC-like DNA-binding protein